MRAGEHWTERSNFQLEFTFIYYDIVHEVQGNIKINEFEWKNGKTASKIYIKHYIYIRLVRSPAHAKSKSSSTSITVMSKSGTYGLKSGL